MSRGPGPVQQWLLAWLTKSVEDQGEAQWASIMDLARQRNEVDAATAQRDVQPVRKAARALERRGLVEVQERRLPKVRTVPTANGPKEVTEERSMLCVRLMPTLQQRYQEALAQEHECQVKVSEHPGWKWAEKALERRRRKLIACGPRWKR